MSVAGDGDVGPITVNPGIQNQGLGRVLMNAVLDRAQQKSFVGVRLLQAAFHNRSLSLYTKLGFAVREPMSVMGAPPQRPSVPGYIVRSAKEQDVAAANTLCEAVHGHSRAGELRDGIHAGTAVVAERDGRMAGYASGFGYFGYAVAAVGTDKVLKDLVIRSRSMAGHDAPYVPGWDCHGLPIEFKVVKEARGLSPVEVRQKSEAMARKFIDIQRAQFKRLGIFGEWDHPYLTLDPAYEASVLRAFATMVDKGLVYQSKKPVYWSTGALTALADAEV
jgi:hypothetical protein